jgi:hypothetical protein
MPRVAGDYGADEEDDESTGAHEESEALKQWDELEEHEAQSRYPTPAPQPKGIKRLTPIEIGMIGLGALVLIFALITVVNLLSA